MRLFSFRDLRSLQPFKGVEHVIWFLELRKVGHVAPFRVEVRSGPALHRRPAPRLSRRMLGRRGMFCVQPLQTTQSRFFLRLPIYEHRFFLRRTFLTTKFERHMLATRCCASTG